MLKFTNSLSVQFLGPIEFQGYMLRHLYQDKLLQCSNPLGELKRIKREAMNKIRFMEITTNDDPDACVLIQEDAIQAGENFFAVREKSQGTIKINISLFK